jgi:predicted transcriptional regulator
MARLREKFTIEVDGSLIAELRRLAKQRGLPLDAVVDQALRTHVEKRHRTASRRRVMDAYRSSLQRYGAFYEKLVK